MTGLDVLCDGFEFELWLGDAIGGAGAYAHVVRMICNDAL